MSELKELDDAPEVEFEIEGDVQQMDAGVAGLGVIAFSTVHKRIAPWTRVKVPYRFPRKPRQIFVQACTAGASDNPDQYGVKVTGLYADKVVFHAYRLDVHRQGNEKFGFHILAIV